MAKAIRPGEPGNPGIGEHNMRTKKQNFTEMNIKNNEKKKELKELNQLSNKNKIGRAHV